jgi:hypothetical protein
MQFVGIQEEIWVMQWACRKEISTGRKAIRNAPVQRTKRCATALLISLLLLAGALWAQTGSEANTSLQDMKLVSAGSGWALAGNRLYWTSDSGQSWNDITPGDGQRPVSKVFFSDTKTGWAVLPGNDGAQSSITVASTRNGGVTWQNTQVALDAIAQGRQIGGVASVYFTGPEQGWIILHLGSSSNFSIGAALHTSDGGLTWTALPSPPAAGNIVFITPMDGWLLGGPSQNQLWFTRDGGQSWQPAAISAPSGCTERLSVRGLPSFTGTTNGRMTAVTEAPAGNCVIDYVTEDSGQSWQPFAVSRTSAALHAAIANTGATARHVYATGSTVFIDQNGVRTQGTIPIGLPPNGNITHAEFLDASTGWLRYSFGACQQSKTACSQQNELLTTADGGNTFTAITPHPGATRQSSSGSSLPLSRNAFAAAQLEGDARAEATAQVAAGTVISNNPGLDIACAPTQSEMQTWWTSSPYHDIGIYLGGCDVYCVSPNGQNTCAANWTASSSKPVDTNLTPTWAASVANMGWGLLPLWVGPQAPCVGAGFWYISSDPESTGAYQADLAIAQANWLGISDGIIYYDMEGYTPDGGSCSNTVKTFLESWTTELHTNNFLSGVYSGENDFETDIVNTSPLPDVVWVAAWDSNTTVWNLGTLSNSDWANNQRIHQWKAETGGETWGGATLEDIDQDTVDAAVIGNWTASTSTFALSNSAAITINTLGSNGTSTISVTPSGGFTGSVNLSCSIAPAAAISPTCSLPASVTIAGTAASSATLTVQTVAPTQAENSPQKNFFLRGGGSIGVCLLLLGIPRRHKGWRKILGVLLLAVSIGTIAGCGGGGSTATGGAPTGGTTPGTYTVTVIGVDQATGTDKSNTAVTLTVN